MEKKRYKSSSLKYSISLEVEGKKVEIEFTRFSSDHRGTSFTTDNEAIQKALESTPAFGVRFFSDRTLVRPTKPKDLLPPKPPKSNLEEKVFDTVNAAKDFFSAEPYNIGTSKLQTKAAIIEEGKTLKFDVKFKTDNK